MRLKGNNKTTFNDHSNEFEQVYIDLRRHEERLYTDEEVAWLPDIADNHVHKKEWEIRKTSCKHLMKYLGSKNKLLRILEVGCGNGWLSYQLSQISDSNVVGLDVNLSELQQAERVFHSVPNLNFIYGEIDSLQRFEKFDVIVFAASIQYFASFADIIEAALDQLNDRGEIHIIDSHFYYETDVEYARQRSRRYFHSKGFDRMEDFYFHHTLKELHGFNYCILYDPNATLNKILKKKNHFHWICIKKG